MTKWTQWNMHLLSGICMPCGHPSHLTFSSWPQSSSHPALTLCFSSAVTFLLSYWRLHTLSLLKPLTSSPSLPLSYLGLQAIRRELRCVPTTLSAQLSASVPGSACCLTSVAAEELSTALWKAATSTFLRSSHWFPLLEPHKVPWCPCRMAPPPTLGLFHLLFILGRGSSPQMFPWLLFFLPSALHSFSLYWWILPGHPVQICSPLFQTSYFFILLYFSLLVLFRSHPTRM